MHSSFAKQAFLTFPTDIWYDDWFLNLEENLGSYEDSEPFKQLLDKIEKTDCSNDR